MNFTIYLLVNQNYNKTYVGFSSEIENRIRQHFAGEVHTTKDFGRFRCFKLEIVASLEEARIRERYWKSCIGRKKIKVYFEKIVNNLPPSSNG
ncbi:MAG: GIY-YIG nuclease family protein [Desulfobacula sp.]